MTSRHLHELIDACRPGHDDINTADLGELASELSRDPNLQRLFERSQEVDETIRDAFQSTMPPPDGLEERLIGAIEMASIQGAESAPTVVEVEPCASQENRCSRRSFALWASVASVSAVAATVALWIGLPQSVSVPLTERGIAERVTQWNADLADADWQTIANIPSDEFPTWQHLKMKSNDRWQWLLKHRIACYDFAIKDATVRLFVIKAKGTDALPTAPPRVAYPSPSGWHVGAWQANGRVYFLAVQADSGSKRLYSRVIASPITPA